MGLAIGQAAAQSRKEAGRLRVPLWIVSALANNFPDLDFLYAGITKGPLGYLLHHRGHTHTLILALPQAAILLGLTYLFARWRKPGWSSADWRWLIFVAVLGPFVHILLDSGNSYGVHPFWPFDNSWKYGDSIFIVEPWFWVSLTPALIFGATSKAAKAVFGLLFAAAAGATLFLGVVSWQMSLIVTFWGIWLLGLMTKLKPRGQAFASLGAYALISLLFVGVSSRTRAIVTQEINAQFPTTEIHELSVSPLPANPFCWQFMSVETLSGQYAVRRGIAAPFAHMISAANCPEFTAANTNAPLSEVPGLHRPHLVWRGQYTGDITKFKSIFQSDCSAQAFLRFSRVPVWRSAEDGTLIVSDLRFDRGGPRGNFAELALSEKTKACPQNLPPWTEPLRGFLDGINLL